MHRVMDEKVPDMHKQDPQEERQEEEVRTGRGGASKIRRVEVEMAVNYRKCQYVFRLI